MSDALRLFLSGGIIAALALLLKNVFLLPSGNWIYLVYIALGLGFYMLVDYLKRMPSRVLIYIGIIGWLSSFAYLTYLFLS